jgi:tagatose 6-phosphate kinase
MILTLGTTPTIARTMRFTQLVPGEVNRAAEVFEYASGKSINAARVAKSLGSNVLAITVAGGERGKMFRTLLQRDDLAAELVESSSATRLCVTAVGPEHATELVEEAGPMSAGEIEALVGKFVARLPAAKFAILSGSLARGVQMDFCARCIQACHERGVMCLLDAAGEPLRQALGAKPNLVKINERELRSITLPGDDLLRSAREIATLTRGWVIITRGGASTLAVSPTQTIDVPARKVAVVSAIGAGDSFAGALAHALSMGQEMQPALDLATAAAAVNCASPHAGFVERAAVDEMLKS